MVVLMAHGIFISYRREDSIGYAGRIYDRLSKHFGKDCVFMDIDTIAPGDDFVEAINRTCASCGVLLALIGKSWATVTDRNGRRRLDNPNDFVRMETAKALASGIRVIPVLLDEAEMPDPQALPEDLQKLAHRHAFHISSLRFHPDVDRLIDAIERSLAASQASASAAAAPAVPALFVPSAAQARLEEEGRQAAEQARLEDERKRAAEQARLEEGRKQAAEQARLDKERKQAAERARREKEVAQRAAEQPRREQNRKRDHEEIIEPPAFSNAPARPVIELEPLPPKTLKIWTPSGEIEVVREQRQYGKTPQADTDRGTIDSEERSRIVEPRSEPSTPAARGHEDETSAQGVPARKWAKALLTLFGLLIVIWGVHSALFPSGKLQIGWKAQTSGTKLGESLSSVQKYATPLAEATTPSLEALKSYSLGRKTSFAKGDAAGLPFFTRAVERDPNFAMAYRSMSIAYGNLNEAGRAADNARRAYELREKVSESERLSIEAIYYLKTTGELEKAAQTYELWQQTYPRDFVGGSLGYIYSTLGNFEKALDETRESMRLDPNNTYTYGELAA